MATIVWFRKDLRLADHAALLAACADRAVIALYILDDTGPADSRMGGAARWWLHHSLAALDGALRAKGSRLILRRGAPADILPEVIAATAAQRVVWGRRYDAHGIATAPGVTDLPSPRMQREQALRQFILVRIHQRAVVPLGHASLDRRVHLRIRVAEQDGSHPTGEIKEAAMLQIPHVAPLAAGEEGRPLLRVELLGPLRHQAGAAGNRASANRPVMG